MSGSSSSQTPPVNDPPATVSSSTADAPVETDAAAGSSTSATSDSAVPPVSASTPAVDADHDVEMDGEHEEEGEDEAMYEEDYETDPISESDEEELPVPAARAIVKLKDIKTLRQAYEDKTILSVEDQKEARAAKAAASGSSLAGSVAATAKAFFGGAKNVKEEKTAVVDKEVVVRFPPDPALLERVSLFQGDITKMQVDSIVNAANRSLLGGGGVDGAIHNAAGPKLLAECRTLGGCETGNSKITRAYELPSNYIIHTVGPIYSSHEVEQKAAQLASCYQTSLDVAVENSIKEIAFPAISTGIYGYPIEDATHIALKVARTFLETNTTMDRIIFVVWSDKDRDVYRELIPEYFPPGEKPAESKEEDLPVVEEATAPAL